MHTTPRNRDKQYWLPKEEYLTAVHFALQYPEWHKKLKQMSYAIKGIDYNGEKVQSHGGYDSTLELAMQRYAIARKIELVEAAAREAAPNIYSYLLKGVTMDKTYEQLRVDGMPCGRRYYQEHRQKFYYLLSLEL